MKRGQFDPKPETLAAMEENFRRLSLERGNLPAVTYRLHRRRAGDRLPPEVWARVRRRYERYLRNAMMRGKKVSTPGQRQPYLMIAIRWELEPREKTLKSYRKAKKTAAQKRYYYWYRTQEAKQRMKGAGYGEGSRG